MPILENNFYTLPTNRNQTLWRYMDFAGFVYVLQTQKLWFSRLDTLDDPFEGTLPKSAKINSDKKIRQAYRKIPEDKRTKSEDEYVEWFAKTFHMVGKQIYVNCWHISDFENMAMWSIYGKGDLSISVKTSLSKLSSALKEDLSASCIEYIDYETYVCETDKIQSYHIYKGNPFKYEDELRLIHLHNDFDKVLDDKGRIDGTKFPRGRGFSVDLEELIEGVYVSPRAPCWFIKLVISEMRQYGLNDKVHLSSQAAKPLDMTLDILGK